MKHYGWSKLKYNIVNEFIKSQMKQNGYHYDDEDLCAEAWRAYLEAGNSYAQVEGCCSFSTYVAFCIHDRINEIQKQKNKRIRLESPLSLDSRFDGEPETIGARYFCKSGDFTNNVILWDFIRHLEKEKILVIWQLYIGLKDREIMEENDIAPEAYYCLLEELQTIFRQWQEI